MTKNEIATALLKMQSKRGQAQGEAYFINLVQSLETQLRDAKRYQEQFTQYMADGLIADATDRLDWTLRDARQPAWANDAEQALASLNQARGMETVASQLNAE